MRRHLTHKIYPHGGTALSRVETPTNLRISRFEASHPRGATSEAGVTHTGPELQGVWGRYATDINWIQAEL